MDFLAGVMAAAAALRHELLMGLGLGVAFALVMYLCRPLLRWSAFRSGNEARRLMHVEIMGRISTYALMGLGYGLQMAGVLVLIPLRPMRPPLETWAVAYVVALLFVFGSVAIALVGARAAKRLAKQVVELRAATSAAA